MTFSVPSISGKTLGTGNDDGLEVRLFLSGGSNFNARTGSIGNQNNTFSLWGIQLEQGSAATPFEHKDYGQELAQCQRYYCTSKGTGQTPSTIGTAATTSALWVNAVFPATMRINPTVTIYDYNNNSGAVNHVGDTAAKTTATAASSQITQYGFTKVDVSGASLSVAAGAIYWLWFTASADL